MMIKKRIIAVALLAAFGVLALAPETLACDRRRRASLARSYYGNQYRYSGVAGQRYYAPSRAYYAPVSRYYAPYRRSHSTRDAILTVAAPAAIAAGVGALLGGKKGAGVGALLGGGGGAAYYLIKRQRNRY
jgi:hypothetical protein